MSHMNRLARQLLGSALAGVLATSLAACSGGGGSHNAALPVTGATQSPTSNDILTTNVTFTIRIPGPSTSAAKRRPAYISQATQSFKFAISAASALTSGQITAYNARPWATVGVGTLPNATCPANGSDYVCTLTVPLPPGTDTLTMSTYASNNGTGIALSEQIQTFTVVVGGLNSFSVTFDANAATMTVNGSGSCANGPVGTAFGVVGTTPTTFSVAFTDASAKTIVTPGLPIISVNGSTTSGTITGTGGNVNFTVNQSAQSFTLTPTTSNTSASVTVSAAPANSNNASDGLSFAPSKVFTYETGPALPSFFLAAVEQTAANTGKVDLYTVTLGSSGAADTFNAYNPTSLAVTNSTNEGKPDVDNPVGMVFDGSNNLLIANGGTTVGGDVGNFACVPQGAISTGANTSTTVETNIDLGQPENPIALGTDGSVGIVNNPIGASQNLAIFTLSGNYANSRNYDAATYGGFSVVALPSLTNGSYAVALSTGTPQSPHGSGHSKVTVVLPSSNYDITDATIDIPQSLAWDASNGQLVIANESDYSLDLDFYTITSSSGTKVKAINTGLNNNLVATSGGYVAVSGATATGYPQVLIFDNTSSRTLVGTIPFNTTTTTCGATYEYPNAVVDSLLWLSNSKLLVGLRTTTGSEQGLYIFDRTATQVEPGFDDLTCAAEPNGPKQTGFQVLSHTPLGTAYKP
jgi:hypothetical protein